MNSVEEAKLVYLNGWRHTNCGGVPYAYVNGNLIKCQKCDYAVASPWARPLGEALAETEFTYIGPVVQQQVSQKVETPKPKKTITLSPALQAAMQKRIEELQKKIEKSYRD